MNRITKDNFKCNDVRREKLRRTAKGNKILYTIYGNHNSKDTMFIMNNVTVSFLCLLAAPWDGGRVPHQNFKAMDVKKHR